MSRYKNTILYVVITCFYKRLIRNAHNNIIREVQYVLYSGTHYMLYVYLAVYLYRIRQPVGYMLNLCVRKVTNGVCGACLIFITQPFKY